MRLTAILTATTLIALATASGLATAGGQEILELDLRPAGGSIYYLGCVTGSKDLTRCGILSIWEQTNPVAGLQTSIFHVGDRPYEPDSNLLS